MEHIPKLLDLAAASVVDLQEYRAHFEWMAARNAAGALDGTQGESQLSRQPFRRGG
jgi:hypothetical protein